MVVGKPLRQPSRPAAEVKCQRCLEAGHWTYECKGKRKFLNRSSRSTMFNKRLKEMDDRKKPKRSNKHKIGASSSSSDSSSTNSSDSSSHESSSESDSDSSITTSSCSCESD